MIRIKIDVAPEREALYREALARLRGVELTGENHADAIITGDPAQADGLPCLLDAPEACSIGLTPGQRVMPGHEWRFLPEIRAVQECQASGQLGIPGLLRVHHWLTGDLRPEQAAFAQIDLAQWIFGCSPGKLHILARPAYLQLHLGFPGDGMALIDVATGRPGTDSYYSMHLIGSDGAAYADDHRNTHLKFGGDGPRVLMHRQNRTLAIQAMLEEFLSGIAENRDWSVTLDDTLNVRKVAREVSNAR